MLSGALLEFPLLFLFILHLEGGGGCLGPCRQMYSRAHASQEATLRTKAVLASLLSLHVSV